MPPPDSTHTVFPRSALGVYPQSRGGGERIAETGEHNGARGAGQVDFLPTQFYADSLSPLALSAAATDMAPAPSAISLLRKAKWRTASFTSVSVHVVRNAQSRGDVIRALANINTQQPTAYPSLRCHPPSHTHTSFFTPYSAPVTSTTSSTTWRSSGHISSTTSGTWVPSAIEARSATHTLVPASNDACARARQAERAARGKKVLSE